jgi:hypothetical protein
LASDLDDTRMSELPEKLRSVELFAWIGEDEYGSGEIGIKQGFVPLGLIPLVSVDQAKAAKLAEQMEHQAKQYGKTIFLCRFTLAEVITATVEGEPLKSGNKTGSA